jgi:hypothetical protein
MKYILKKECASDVISTKLAVLSEYLKCVKKMFIMIFFVYIIIIGKKTKQFFQRRFICRMFLRRGKLMNQELH